MQRLNRSHQTQNYFKMDTIDLNALLKSIKKAVSDQNSQVPTILVTGDSKFLVDVIRAEYSSCYSVCGHPQDESKSYYFLKPAECDLYYFVYTRFNEFGDLQYAIDIATKGHKPSFIINKALVSPAIRPISFGSKSV